jgi:hypothetical protein
MGGTEGRCAMSHAITEAARELAPPLVQHFSDDAELAKRLATAQERLRSANDRLWCGVHPDGLSDIYGEDPAAVQVAFAANRSEVLGAPDPLRAAQHVHWSIRKAFIACQPAAEGRRQLAAEVGETIRQFVDELLAAGWSEQQARDANVHELATPTEQPTTKGS